MIGRMMGVGQPINPYNAVFIGFLDLVRRMADPPPARQAPSRTPGADREGVPRVCGGGSSSRVSVRIFIDVWRVAAYMRQGFGRCFFFFAGVPGDAANLLRASDAVNMREAHWGPGVVRHR